MNEVFNMAITPIEFGKNLRPSTVDALNKINEIVTIVNKLNPSDISQLTTDVSTLKSQMSTAQGDISKAQNDISTANNDIAALEGTVNGHTSDLNNIKTTLYTPLQSDETKGE